MALYQQISDELKAAMKQGDTGKRDTLRLLQSAVKNTAIEKRKAPAELSDAEVEEVIRRLVKQRKDSIAQYRAGAREDLALKEEAELVILSKYLPLGMPEAELSALVKQTLQEIGATSKADMGKAMGAVMKKVAGRAEGDQVRGLVEAELK